MTVKCVFQNASLRVSQPALPSPHFQPSLMGWVTVQEPALLDDALGRQNVGRRIESHGSG